MSVMIETRVEGARGCGFREPGGLYLCADGPGIPCGKLPVPLAACPTCGGGIHFSRSWTWVNGTALLAEKQCSVGIEVLGDCLTCPLSRPMGRCGLLWIGEKFYATPRDWTEEAAERGVSRRIAAVPRDFELGKTWVLVAHKKAYWEPCQDCLGQGSPGELNGEPCKRCKDDARGVAVAAIFHAFRPARIEYVVCGDETDADLERRVKSGQTLVRVEKAEASPAN